MSLSELDDFDFSIFDMATASPCVRNGTCEDFQGGPSIGWRHWFALACYGAVFLVGVPGNGLVVWVTAFRTPLSVNALWFLNLALADLLCCLSLPLLMVPLAQDLHWPFGLAACKVLYSLFHATMYCSVLLLVLISLDRWVLVTRPAWCQNWRRPRWAGWACLGTWVLALLASVPQFAHMTESAVGRKTECISIYGNKLHASAAAAFHFVVGFAAPFLLICASHWTVYRRAGRRPTGRRGQRSARTLRVILAVVLSFFLCWAPLHVLDLVLLGWQGSEAREDLLLAHVLAHCLAYFNSCLNPLLYVCLGRGFRESMTQSLRSVLRLASVEPAPGHSMSTNTKSTTEGINLNANKVQC